MRYHWKAAGTEALIKIYRANPCLYDTSSPNYRNKQNQREVLQQIADAVNDIEEGFIKVTIEECRLKCYSLRRQFSREYKKMIKSKSKVWSSATNEYTSKWHWFESLLFLRNFDYEEDDDDIDEEEEELEINEESAEDEDDDEEEEEEELKEGEVIVGKEQNENKKGDDVLKLP